MARFGVAGLVAALLTVAATASQALASEPAATLSFVRHGSIFVASPDLRTSTVYLAASADRGNSYTYSGPAWSPDGTSLAASEGDTPTDSEEFPSERLVVVRPGGQVVVVCDWDEPCEYASWAPDGQRLAFLDVDFFTPYEVGEMSVVNLATGHGVDVTPFRDPSYPTDTAPALSPDGKVIAFVRLDDPTTYYGTTGHILVIAPTGGGIARRIADAANATDLSWSPDGRQVAFDDGRRIGIASRSGGSVRFVAKGTDPAWSPDGSTIAYVNHGNIWLVDATGQRPRLAIKNATDPAWRPSP